MPEGRPSKSNAEVKTKREGQQTGVDALTAQGVVLAQVELRWRATPSWIHVMYSRLPMMSTSPRWGLKSRGQDRRACFRVQIKCRNQLNAQPLIFHWFLSQFLPQ